jgi:hypothetical protein
LSYFKKWDKTIHAEKCKNYKAASNYCKKSASRIEGPWEIGIKPLMKSGGDRKTLDGDLI